MLSVTLTSFTEFGVIRKKRVIDGLWYQYGIETSELRQKPRIFFQILIFEETLN